MRRLSQVCFFSSLLAPCGYASPTEDAIVAIMRLSDQPNYSWIATVADDARTYDIFGKTVRGGFTQVKMPVINSVRRKLGRSVTDTQVDLIFRGNVHCVIETEDGWRKPSELPMLSWNAPEARRSRPPPSVGPILGSSRVSLQGATVPQPGLANRNTPNERSYSNLQLALSHPHEELGVIVGSHDTLNVEGAVVTGSLTELGAQLLLVRDGQKYIEPIAAHGTFKLWLRDGMVTKYQVTLEGTLNVHLQSGRRKVEVHQTTDTILKDIGTTNVEVPDQARVKLGT
jgi:hypothetical protein